MLRKREQLRPLAKVRFNLAELSFPKVDDGNCVSPAGNKMKRREKRWIAAFEVERAQRHPEPLNANAGATIKSATLRTESNMRVFISFAKDDASLAEKLEAALRRNNIEAWSTLDAASGEDWRQLVERESANADGYVFLFGAGTPPNPQLQAEWRSLLRNDTESRKPLIPVIHAHGSVAHDLPPFLRNRRAIITTNFDSAIGELRYLVEHSSETLDHSVEQRSRAEQEKRLNELRNHALSLKEENAGGGTKPQ